MRPTPPWAAAELAAEIQGSTPIVDAAIYLEAAKLALDPGQQLSPEALAHAQAWENGVASRAEYRQVSAAFRLVRDTFGELDRFVRGELIPVKADIDAMDKTWADEVRAIRAGGDALYKKFHQLIRAFPHEADAYAIGDGTRVGVRNHLNRV